MAMQSVNNVAVFRQDRARPSDRRSVIRAGRRGVEGRISCGHSRPEVRPARRSAVRSDDLGAKSILRAVERAHQVNLSWT